MKAAAAPVSRLLSRVAHAGHVGNAGSICQKGGGGGETGLERKKGKTKGCGVGTAQRRASLRGTSLCLGWSPSLHPEKKADVSREEGMLPAKPGREDQS